MALSPGGFVVILLLPLVGRLVSQGRRALHDRLRLLRAERARSSTWRTHIYTADRLRDGGASCASIQSVGLAFLFVPIKTLVVRGRARRRRTTRSRGIMNLSRNMGGDIGIAFVTTLIARRSQIAPGAASPSHTTAYDPPYQAKLAAHRARRSQHAGAVVGRRGAAGHGRDVPPARAAGDAARLPRRALHPRRRRRRSWCRSWPCTKRPGPMGAPAAH